MREAGGVLRIGGVAVTELAAEFGTPAYLLDEAEFDIRCDQLRVDFSGFDIYYAGKAFLCIAAAKAVADRGLSLDVCSRGELAVAEAAGFPPERILLHGNNKSAEEVHHAVVIGVGRVVIDSAEEIDLVATAARALQRRVDVLVRVTADVRTDAHEHNATGHVDQKFGFTHRDGTAQRAIQRIQTAPELRLVGLHTHIGSQITSATGFADALRALLDLRGRLPGAPLSEVNLGGGFGIAHRPGDTELDTADLARSLRAVAATDPNPPQLAVEPGRAIAGPAGATLYRVGNVRRRPNGRTFVAVDGGLSDNIRPALLGAEYAVVLANRVSEALPVPVRVVGKHCDAGDVVVRDGLLPGDIRAGDLLLVPRTGAYCRSWANNFNSTPRPPVIGVRGGVARPLVRRETLSDLLGLDACWDAAR